MSVFRGLDNAFRSAIEAFLCHASDHDVNHGVISLGHVFPSVWHWFLVCHGCFSRLWYRVRVNFNESVAPDGTSIISRSRGGLGIVVFLGVFSAVAAWSLRHEFVEVFFGLVACLCAGV